MRVWIARCSCWCRGHHGPWVWERPQRVLEAGGWSTRAVRLVSAVEDTTVTEPLPGMYDDARVIREVLVGIATDAPAGPDRNQQCVYGGRIQCEEAARRSHVSASGRRHIFRSVVAYGRPGGLVIESRGASPMG